MLLLLKLTLSPTLVALASKAARKYGPSVGGWIAGFPIVAGPVLFFYAWEQGPAFGAHAAHSTLMGLASLCAFAIAYGYAARIFPWYGALASGYAVFATGTFLLQGASLPLWVASLVGVTCLAATWFLLPEAADDGTAKPHPRWDVPMRMAATAAIVVTLTYLAAWLGPRLSGLLTPFPVATTVLVAFAHHQSGAGSAARVLRGLIGALFGFAAFCTVLAAGLEGWGTGLAFGLALLSAAVLQGLSLLWMQR
jgi:hypothetical protein